MPSLTIKNIPDDLFNSLKHKATVHRRSLNSEVLICLEKALQHNHITPELRLENAKTLRSKIQQKITPAEIKKAIDEGRS